ncbi:hypothetical protein J1N35_037506 [Gossypium stocksii]|uniref:Uncharacterized protein n=1 Tax=Gossypium stocksii TaxID=47602 RepID=A0A9D3UK61_9ROSI|nr:hypothetical protein J1N35_037506 [Gossypium stocksii]
MGIIGLDNNLLTSPTNHRVIASVGIDQASEDTLSEIDSISPELNEVMDIDFLVSGARKKCKTTTGAVRISFTSEEEGNSAQLEHHSKRRVDPVGVAATVVGALSPCSFPLASLPSISPTSSLITIDVDTLSLVACAFPSVPVITEAMIKGQYGGIDVWRGLSKGTRKH